MESSRPIYEYKNFLGDIKSPAFIVKGDIKKYRYNYFVVASNIIQEGLNKALFSEPNKEGQYLNYGCLIELIDKTKKNLTNETINTTITINEKDYEVAVRNLDSDVELIMVKLREENYKKQKQELVEPKEKIKDLNLKVEVQQELLKSAYETLQELKQQVKLNEQYIKWIQQERNVIERYKIIIRTLLVVLLLVLILFIYLN